MDNHDVADTVVIGAGAAGIFAALAARGALCEDGSLTAPASDAPRVVLLDGESRPGRKILISGGGRCNVTNTEVSERDYWSESPMVVRNVLREFPPENVRTFFLAGGLELTAEPMGKVFPRFGRAKDVLDVLFSALETAGVELRTGALVTALDRDDDGAVWHVGGTQRPDDTPWTLAARRVVIATGGLSVPSTGSRGFGLELAAQLGHYMVAPVPALAPLVLEQPLDLSGVTLPATLFAEDADGRIVESATGSLMFTHDGLTGPAALDLSGAVERALASGKELTVYADLWGPSSRSSPFGEHLGGPKLPGACLRPAMAPAEPLIVERELTDAAQRAGRQALGTFLTTRLPRRVVQALLPRPATPLAALGKEARRDAARAVCRLPLSVRGSSGYAKAEVTAGGVALGEVDRRTFESRRCPGLHFCGEVLDATGRLGGFNFQWAWASGFLAGRGTRAR